MIWVFKNKHGEYLLVGAQSEEEAINIIKARGWESSHGELHTELRFVSRYDGVLVNGFIGV